MVSFNKFKLDNGLTIIVHEDPNTPMAVLNLLYKVGSKDEMAHKTGFAHLFEHLMFGGSKNIENFDEPLQRAGGENNAFTNPDITNYYDVVPAQNLETAFWLESDRMLSLSFDQKVLDVQKGVVCEEFKERYINEPYGMAWLKLRPLAYKNHPYKWATIGKELSHIENATMQDVKDFFYKFYRPNNAILVLAGDLDIVEAKKLATKYYGKIAPGPESQIKYAEERSQVKKNLTIHYDQNTKNTEIKISYLAPDLLSKNKNHAYSLSVLSYLLAGNKNSILYKKLVTEFHILTLELSNVSEIISY